MPLHRATQERPPSVRYRLRATVALRVILVMVSAARYSVAEDVAAEQPDPVFPQAIDAPQYFLTANVLTRLRATAKASGPEWRAFKARLDVNLAQVTTGEYQGFQLPAAADYALGYKILKEDKPATAAAYADKAIAILSCGLRDDIKQDWGTRQFLARGDGTTTEFIIPNSSVNASTLKVFLQPVRVKQVSKGAPHGQDAVDYYFHFLKVSNTPDGTPDYAAGIDWRYNPEYRGDMLDWSLPGKEPPSGATYYVTEATAAGAKPLIRAWSIRQNRLVFRTTPAADQTIFVEYQYSTPTLKYQQTSDGRGGFNNILIDSGYTTRNLKYIAIATDWLWDYPGFPAALRSEAIRMLVHWSDYLKQPGVYMANTPSSNYGAGDYALRIATAIILQNRDPANAVRLKAEMEAYRDAYVLPLFRPPHDGKGTEQGGFWSEGWNYGPLAIRNILTSDLACEAAGWGNADSDRSWANEVITALLTEQPTPETIYDGGDGYAWPLPFPNQTLLRDLAHVATNPALKSYARWAMSHGAGRPDLGWEDLLFEDPGAPAAFWGNSLPLQHLSPGTGLGVARKDWSYQSTWISFHCGNLTDAAHQATDQGNLEINHGPDALLVNAAAVGQDQTFQHKSTYGNLLVIDDGGAGEQTYRYAEGVWYGSPGVTMPHFAGTSDYSYMQGNYAAAYRRAHGEAGSPNPVSELVRDVFYLRAVDYVIVYDRTTTTQPQYLKELRWHFTAKPVLAGGSWTVLANPPPAPPSRFPRPGSQKPTSKLFGHTFSDASLKTAVEEVQVGDGKLWQVTTKNEAPTCSVRYVTAMQVASSAVATMDTATHVVSGDGKLEGVQMGPSTGSGYVVLFGKKGAVSGGISYQVTVAPGQTLTHYLTDVAPGTMYTLTGANQGSATADAQGVVTFTTTGTGSAQTVGLTPA